MGGSCEQPFELKSLNLTTGGIVRVNSDNGQLSIAASLMAAAQKLSKQQQQMKDYQAVGIASPRKADARMGVGDESTADRCPLGATWPPVRQGLPLRVQERAAHVPLSPD